MLHQQRDFELLTLQNRQQTLIFDEFHDFGGLTLIPRGPELPESVLKLPGGVLVVLRVPQPVLSRLLRTQVVYARKTLFGDFHFDPIMGFPI